MIPQVLFNTNLFVGTTSFAGDVPSLTLPKMKKKLEPYRAGGMDAEIDMDMGLEKMDAAFTTTGVRKESMLKFGLVDQNAFEGTFRGAFKGQGGVMTGAVATIRGQLTELDAGDWKAGDKAEFKYTVNCTYYKFEVDGAVWFEFDPVNSIRIVDGVDQLDKMREILGI
jgi:P2 family phage contractile tail tube protein